MTKVYCDRCGKAIKFPKSTTLRHRTFYAKLFLSSFRATEGDVWHEICSDCEDSFVKWFNHPENDDA